MSPEIKDVLTRARRALRSSASMMENSRVGFSIMRGTSKDPKAKAVMDAYLNMLPETIAQMRSVADDADKYLRAGAVTDDELEGWRQRAMRAFAQSGAIAKEAGSVINPERQALG